MCRPSLKSFIVSIIYSAVAISLLIGLEHSRYAFINLLAAYWECKLGMHDFQEFTGGAAQRNKHVLIVPRATIF